MTPKEIAEQEFEKKLSLERSFLRVVRSIFARTVRDFRVSVASTGTASGVKNFESDWVAALDKHYSSVQRAFKGNILEHQEKQSEEDINEELLAALLLWRNNVATEQASFIVETNEGEMEEALIEGRQALVDEGQDIDNRSLAAVSSVILGRKFRARDQTIALSETQGAAESTKFIEASVREEIPQQVDVDPPKFEKTWVNFGDSVVRESHVRANNQTVNSDLPFIVGGFPLMYPRDGSLGAPLKELINCRCSAVYRQVRNG